MKRYKKRILVWIFIQLLILLLIGRGIYSYVSIDEKSMKQVSVVVDNTDYIYYIAREHRFVIYADSDTYSFPSGGFMSSEYTNRELYETIRVGDELSITYEERYEFLLGKVRRVVDARTESVVYRSFEIYMTDRYYGFIGLIILFVVIELMYVFGFIVDRWLNSHAYGTKRKKKQKTK